MKTSRQFRTSKQRAAAHARDNDTSNTTFIDIIMAMMGPIIGLMIIFLCFTSLYSYRYQKEVEKNITLKEQE